MQGLREAVEELPRGKRRLLAAWLQDGERASDAAVDRRRLVAHVVPGAASIPDGGAAADPETRQDRLRQWRDVYDALYAEAPGSGDPTFDTTGWVDSYGSRPIPADEMREWLEHTIHRIERLRPQRVLEIGCGTGLILFRVAPQVRAYVATDFSPAVVERLKRTCTLGNVSLQQRHAHDFEGLADEPFDLVILNSVVQYFPGVEYLIETLEGALRVLAPGGHIFVGDVRNQALLDAFHLTLELPHAAPGSRARRLMERVRGRAAYEEELVIDPAFFGALPGIAAIEVGSSRVDLQACKLEYSIVSPK